jgi:hypothetical protein
MEPTTPNPLPRTHGTHYPEPSYNRLVPPELSATFTALRGMLKTHAATLTVTADTPTDFVVASKTKTDRRGRPMFVAGVQVRKRYVSYHLMPIYMMPALLTSMSPELKKRLQGKGCFNFTEITHAQLRELSRLTKKGIAGFKNFPLPWDKPSKK